MSRALLRSLRDRLVARWRGAGLQERLLAMERDVDRLRSQVKALERALAAAGKNPRALWLYANRVERMDANEPLFEPSRRAFHLARYEFAAPYAAGGAVADIACGTGYGCFLLADQGKAREVIGVDVDPDAVSYAAETYAAPNIRFVCAPGEATGLPEGSVDLVTSFETLEHLDEPGRLVAEFERILRPEGTLILSTPNQWEDDHHPHHHQSFSLEDLQRILAPKFAVVSMHNQNSGSNAASNHGQPAGFVATTPANRRFAECFVAVCRRR